MAMKEIEECIRQMLAEERGVVLNRPISVKKQEDMYELDIFLYGNERPASIVFQGELEDFLAYVKEQINIKRLDEVEYWKGYRIETSNPCNYEQRGNNQADR